ncbi:hypothetical protein BC835DRAFT_1019914 [Cytidiella melzeri]|nr:hypothetical protein BC835DRAFT_1019914 [Cytidiella melzeri]
MVAQFSKVRYAYWIGYQLSIEDFISFVAGLPPAIVKRNLYQQENDTAEYQDYFSAYIKWRRTLPKEQWKHSLRALYRHLPDGQTATHVVFFTRYVNYKGPQQVEDPADPDYSVIHEELAEDAEKLKRFVELAREYGGEPNINKFEFTFKKELHPTTDWRIF